MEGQKWNAWRYLAMLANPRTHVRNVAGNVFFQPLRIVKDRVAAAIEAGVSRTRRGKKLEQPNPFWRLQHSTGRRGPTGPTFGTRFPGTNMTM